MVLFFTHIPFVVNHTINATPPERLQQYHICFAGLGKHQNAVEQFYGSMAKEVRKCVNVDISSCKWTFYNWRLTLLRQTVADLLLYVVVFMYACPFRNALLQAELYTFVLFSHSSFWRKNYVTRVQLSDVVLVTAECCHVTDPASHEVFLKYIS